MQDKIFGLYVIVPSLPFMNLVRPCCSLLAYTIPTLVHMSKIQTTISQRLSGTGIYSCDGATHLLWGGVLH